MIAEIEKSFVKRFIKKKKQDRLLFELGGKKRQHGIGRFCHSTEDMIDTERITYSGNDLFSDEILRITRQYKVPELCYIIAYQKELDKKYVSFEDALGLVLGNGMAAIIYAMTSLSLKQNSIPAHHFAIFYTDKFIDLGEMIDGKLYN